VAAATATAAVFLRLEALRQGQARAVVVFIHPLPLGRNWGVFVIAKTQVNSGAATRKRSSWGFPRLQ
jgi:hypothetical protein